MDVQFLKSLPYQLAYLFKAQSEKKLHEKGAASIGMVNMNSVIIL